MSPDPEKDPGMRPTPELEPRTPPGRTGPDLDPETGPAPIPRANAAPIPQNTAEVDANTTITQNTEMDASTTPSPRADAAPMPQKAEVDVDATTITQNTEMAASTTPTTQTTQVNGSATPIQKSESNGNTPPSLYSLAASHTRTSSRSSSDYDPLSPLEHALTPDLRTDTERNLPLAATQTRTSIGSAASRPPDYEVVFEPDDPENPVNWPLWYRSYVIFCVSYSTWVVVLYSTSYTATIPGVMEEYDVTSTPVATLGLTTYLLGLAMGSVVVAPLSELYGRRMVYIVCIVIFTVLIAPCGVATSLAQIIVVRFFGALFGAALVSNSPGTVVDISTEKYLALCMSLWSIAPLNGPVTGPLIGGFVYQYLGWRWANWIAMILAAVACVLMISVRETYAPTILKRKAARRRKETDDERWWCRYDERISTTALLKINLSRPFVLAATEPILWFFNVWISVIYAILYLCFVAYPFVFVQARGWSPSMTGLSFLGIGIGTLIAIFLEPLWRRLINAHAPDPATGRPPPEASGCLMCIGAVLTPLGQLAFSWTCLPVTISHLVPIACGVPFGIGNTLCFLYGSNYLAAAYGEYAASALAGNTVMRSVFGAVIPLAGPAMYSAMGARWAGTLLGVLEVVLIPIPVVFYFWGDRIRGKSKVIREMRERKEKEEGRREKHLSRVARRDEAGMGEKGLGRVVTGTGGLPAC